MEMFICIIALLLLLSACGPNFVESQELGFWVLKPCPDLPKENDKEVWQRETAFHVGCTVQMICTCNSSRLGDHCSNKQTINLTVDHPPHVTIHEVNRTRCSLTVEIQNMTQEDEGLYKCNDVENSRWRPRKFQIGYPPEVPGNLTLVFEPKRHVSLLLDQGKTAQDLNDNHTKWIVNYSWRNIGNFTPCPAKGTGVDRNGRYVACKLILRGKYDGLGQYGEKLGNTYSYINFTVYVENSFGTTPSIYKTFRPQKYIKPGELRDFRVEKRGDSWISVRMTFPRGIEKRLCRNMKENNRSALRIQYRVALISEEQQHRLQNASRQFYDLHGFYRNLRADEAALNKILLHSSAFFSAAPFIIDKTLLWSDCKSRMSVVNITDLPLPNTRYKIIVRAGGRYWGPWSNITDTSTGESVPSEGPQLGSSFCTCFNEDQCVTCLLYFKEIPRCLRGGNILLYSLTGKNTLKPALQFANCSNAKQFTVVTEGEDNTMFIRGLIPDTAYNLSLRAHTKKGDSPATVALLNTSKPSPAAGPQHVVVVKHGETYEVSWRAPEPAPAGRFRYFVHHCYATELQDEDLGTIKDINNLDCKSNIVTEPHVNSTARMMAVTVRRYRGSSSQAVDLTPTFFVSMERQDGVRSHLVHSECLYANDRAPSKVKPVVLSVENNPDKLLMKFTHQCKYSYLHGRPSKFCVVVAEKTEDQECSHLSVAHGEEKCTEHVNPNIEKEMLFSGLKKNTRYCVAVKVLKTDVDPVWGFSDGKTVDDVSRTFVIDVIIIVVSVAVFIILVVMLVMCLVQYRRRSKKFTSFYIPKPKFGGIKQAPPVPSVGGKVKTAMQQLKEAVQSKSSNKDSGVIVSNDGSSENQSLTRHHQQLYEVPAVNVDEDPGVHCNTCFVSVDETAKQNMASPTSPDNCPTVPWNNTTTSQVESANQGKLRYPACFGNLTPKHRSKDDKEDAEEEEDDGEEDGSDTQDGTRSDDSDEDKLSEKKESSDAGEFDAWEETAFTVLTKSEALTQNSEIDSILQAAMGCPQTSLSVNLNKLENVEQGLDDDYKERENLQNHVAPQPEEESVVSGWCCHGQLQVPSGKTIDQSTVGLLPAGLDEINVVKDNFAAILMAASSIELKPLVLADVAINDKEKVSTTVVDFIETPIDSAPSAEKTNKVLDITVHSPVVTDEENAAEAEDHILNPFQDKDADADQVTDSSDCVLPSILDILTSSDTNSDTDLLLQAASGCKLTPLTLCLEPSSAHCNASLDSKPHTGHLECRGSKVIPSEGALVRESSARHVRDEARPLKVTSSSDSASLSQGRSDTQTPRDRSGRAAVSRLPHRGDTFHSSLPVVEDCADVSETLSLLEGSVKHEGREDREADERSGLLSSRCYLLVTEKD